MSRNRARLQILNEILSFPHLGNYKWKTAGFVETPCIGDLVAINCAATSKYYLAWLRDYKPNNGNPEYLLESIEDGERCWWSNVGISFYDRERINSPLWQWDDDQYAFYDRWNRVAYKKNGAYIVLPMFPVFHDDGSVVLNVRIRFNFSNYHNPKTFPHYKKVSMKMMDEYYKKSEKEYETTALNKTLTEGKGEKP